MEEGCYDPLSVFYFGGPLVFAKTHRTSFEQGSKPLVTLYEILVVSIGILIMAYETIPI